MADRTFTGGRFALDVDGINVGSLKKPLYISMPAGFPAGVVPTGSERFG